MEAEVGGWVDEELPNRDQQEPAWRHLRESCRVCRAMYCGVEGRVYNGSQNSPWGDQLHKGRATNEGQAPVCTPMME